MKINFIFRAQKVKRLSIETVFNTIMLELNKKVVILQSVMKFDGASLWSILCNVKTKISQADVYHVTGHVHYMALRRPHKTVLTIHDIQSAIRGTYLKRIYIGLFWFWLPALLVKRITVISEFTKMELLKIAPFAEKKIRVIPNPINLMYQYNPAKFNSKTPLILVVGTKSNKNIERILIALNGIDCSLHLIGFLNQEQQQLLNKLNINYTNSTSLSKLEMYHAYQDADILCFPSTYEGFGMPIIEAQAVGRVVITSNFGAMLEVAQTSACLVNPFDIQSIRKGLIKVIENQDYREQLIEKGLNNVKRFDPKNITEAYLNIYEDISKQK